MRKYLIVWLLMGWMSLSVSGQGTTGSVVGQDSSNHVITTAVPFLGITPDSRAAGMGDAGVATSADANASYWNPGKLVFIDKGGYGFSTSYTPWLAKIVNDMKLLYLTGFYRIDRNQVVSGSLKYFDMGAIQLNHGPDPSQQDGRYNPREFAFDVTYSRLLTDHFGLGGSLRYVRSNLTGAIPTNPDARAGNSVAVDIGAFYTKQFERHNSTLSLGGSITNFGSKMTYTSAANKDFIPTNLRLGGAYKTELDHLNSLTFALDFNKLMVPSKNTAQNTNRSTPLFSGVLGSFTDASLARELAEIKISTGMEYWYNNFFAARVGYFYETKDQGNRKYLTAGLGVRYEMANRDMFGLDMAYLIPTVLGNYALAETIRFSLFYVLPIKEAKQNDTPND
ncbi:MAG: type IX secretion system outer membrane channel protein PorV [Bacteroidetes bacterium]|nr:type IX secretion system outer membrane channel protein PorV [Bacteroidota bacterium]